MGFSSYNCRECSNPALGPLAINKINGWMCDVVVIEHNNNIIIGEFDGYSHVDGKYVGYKDRPALYHHACWVKAGSPDKYDGQGSTLPENQGWFFAEGAYDLEKPTTE